MKVNSVNCLSLKTAKDRNYLKNSNTNTFNDNIYLLTNCYYPTFMSKSKICSIGEEYQDLQDKEKAIADEKRLSKIARDNGVNTPKISDNNTYIIKGQIADCYSNPVNNAQLTKTLNNIFLMDEVCLFHGDLEIGHIFYSSNIDNPEFDCFRAGYEFSKDKVRNNWEFPKIVYPTNLYQFENNWIGCYTSQMSEDKRDEFIKDYLVISSDFHQKRVDILTNKEDATNEQIEFEKLQAELYKNPTPTLIELFKDRVNFQYLDRLAFTETDEGQGACGHKPDEDRVVKGNAMYFDVLKLALKYVDKIKSKQSEIDDEDMSKLLEYIESYGTHQINNLLNANIGRCLWSVDPKNEKNIKHQGSCDIEKERFERLYQEMLNAHKNNNKDLEYTLINEVQKAYLEMAKKAEINK